MNLTRESALGLARIVGQPYARLNCWELVRFCFGTQGIELPVAPKTAVGTLFRKLGPDEEPRPWDLMGIRNHEVLVNHAGIYLGDGRFLHSMEDTGVLISRLAQKPWSEPGRIAEYHRLLASES